MGLEMKYFVLKPKSKFRNDPHAHASRNAMRVYADAIRACNPNLADDLITWALKEECNDEEM